MEWVSFLRWGTLKMHNFSLLFIFHLVQEKLFHFKWFETCLTLVYGAPLGERRGWLLFPLDSWEAWDSCLGVAATLIECPGQPTLSSFLKTQISKSGNRQSYLSFSHFLPPIPMWKPSLIPYIQKHMGIWTKVYTFCKHKTDRWSMVLSRPTTSSVESRPFLFILRKIICEILIILTL